MRINHRFQTNYVVSGIAPFGEMMLILAYTMDQLIEEEATENLEQQRRKVRFLSVNSTAYENVS